MFKQKFFDMIQRSMDKLVLVNACGLFMRCILRIQDNKVYLVFFEHIGETDHLDFTLNIGDSAQLPFEIIDSFELSQRAFLIKENTFEYEEVMTITLNKGLTFDEFK